MGKKHINKKQTRNRQTGTARAQNNKAGIPAMAAKWLTPHRMKKLLVILAGNFIFTAGVVYFALPAGLIVGGTTGISLNFQHYFGIPIDVFSAIFNAVMFIFGAVILGKAFAMTTLLSSIAFPCFLNVLQKMAAVTGYPTTDEMLCTVFGGILIGFGIAIVIHSGASTGGMDIPPLAINKVTGIPVAALMYVFDFFILLSQIVFTDSEKVMYGILMACITSVMLNKVLVTGKSRIQLMIISKEYQTINEMLLHQFDRGTTLIEVAGGYTCQETYAVMTVVNSRDVFAINEAIKQVDPAAFVIIEQVKEVRGVGFTLRRSYYKNRASGMK